MYKQFFGNYLLNKNAATPEQLIHAINKTSSSPMKLRTLAMYYDFMNSHEINEVVEALEDGKREFAELAIERQYLTGEQVDQLISKPHPDYLLLGQILVEEGVLTYAELEDLIIDYEAEHEMYDLDMQIGQKEQVNRLIRNYFKISDAGSYELYETYLILLFNNLIRFIGTDFTPLAPVRCEKFPAQLCRVQRISGRYQILSAIEMEQSAAAEFASRYAMDTFDADSEYVQASLSDFLNLQNGLFSVNMSNNYSIDLKLAAPITHDDDLLIFPDEDDSYIFPVLYPFGTIHFILSLRNMQE